MSKDFLKINSYVMDDVSGLLSRDRSDFESTGDKCERDFAVMKNGTLFNTGIKKINAQFDDLVARLNYMNNSINKNTNEFFELEKQLNSEAMQIEIPLDFETTDSVTGKTFESVTLNKHDGRSVNDGKELFDNTTEFNSSIGNIQSLGNIKNAFESSTEDINNYTENRVSLGNINNDNEQSRQDLNEYTNTDNTLLGNVNKASDLSVNNITDGTVIKRSELDNLGGDR